jgi:hypothetical protein
MDALKFQYKKILHGRIILRELWNKFKWSKRWSNRYVRNLGIQSRLKYLKYIWIKKLNNHIIKN